MDTPPAEPAPRYLVTARKYRPQTFADLVAQEHVARTLQNAIRLDRLAHAYLFSGPRGVGKTTAARLLAKAVNCQTPLAEREGAEPCRTCDACVSFEEGRAMNVIEIDAASNNKVDDVRDLRETVRIPPQGAPRKVYILDEVHMLSQGAFNALLKTLEEPPAHALFIFATTEPHKVPATILSRCQRFDFRRIAVPEIVARLRHIGQEEGVAADDESLMLIARKGDGALRDALSLFDQAVALCGADLKIAELREALGVVDSDLYFATTDRAAAHDRAGMLRLVDDLMRRGHDPAEFLGGLAEHLRNLLVAASTGSADLVEATDATRRRYAEAAMRWAEADLLHLLMLADEGETALKGARQPRLTLELALLKMASLEGAADLAALVEKLDRLEAALVGGAPLELRPPETAEPPAPRPTAPAVSAEAPAAYAPAPPQEAPPAFPDPQPTPRDEDGPEDDEPGPPTFSPLPPTRPSSQEPAPPEPAPAAPPAMPGLFGAPALGRRRGGGDGAGPTSALPGGDGAGADAPEAPVVLEPPAPRPAVDEHFGVSVARVREAWPRLVARVRASRVDVGALLTQVEPFRAAGGGVEVAVPDAFTRDLLDGQAALLAEALRAELGEGAPPLRFAVRPRAQETAGPTDPFERLKELRQEHPVFRVLFERFGAEPSWT